jgi:hypothetical protein
MNKIALIWEIPLALLSFLFYKVMKFIIGNLFTIYLSIDKQKASQWRILSQKVIDSPLSLPVLMTKGPRWNTHAVIGTLGPFLVKESIEFDLVSVRSSARSWIVVVYSFPSYQTIASVASHQTNSEAQWHKIKLNPGKYSLGVRYYQRYNLLNFPAIKIDDNNFVEPQPVANNVNEFYNSLIQRKNWFYASLHYYIYLILKWRKWLPESFVRSEFLPVGAPATNFVYNYLDKGQALQLDFAIYLIENCDIYFTLYDRSSLPLSWCQIDRENYNLSASETCGFYLLRIRPKPETGEKNITIKFKSILEDKLMQHYQIDLSEA